MASTAHRFAAHGPSFRHTTWTCIMRKHPSARTNVQGAAKVPASSVAWASVRRRACQGSWCDGNHARPGNATTSDTFAVNTAHLEWPHLLAFLSFSPPSTEDVILFTLCKLPGTDGCRGLLIRDRRRGRPRPGSHAQSLTTYLTVNSITMRRGA